jgi:hypothetical protein
MTPNTSSAQAPYAFYPLWSSDQGILVRYGSMAQYGTTLMFLSEDSAYTMTPGGLSEVGQNIANLLRNSSIWTNGMFPLQGLYGSIVEIEGEKHYLIALSADDDNFTGAGRMTEVYDLNMNLSNWHFWGSYAGYTLTCPIYQSFDLARYTGEGSEGELLARDSWMLCGMTKSIGFSQPFSEGASVYELAPMLRTVQLMATFPVSTALFPPVFSYQFRTETPSIARLQSERRILIEYENSAQLLELGVTPAIALQYFGQQDPTAQTGTVVQESAEFVQNLTYQSTNTIPGQILTQQVDFGTFTSVCISLFAGATGNNALFALVRMTQISDVAKGMVP